MKLETAQKAAKWWADQLRGTSKLDAGSDFGGGIAIAFMLQELEKSKQSDEQINKFESCLCEIILKRDVRRLGVDYDPDAVLCDAADEAGIDLGMTTLPWKTSMYIQDDVVKVACGYHSEFVEL